MTKKRQDLTYHAERLFYENGFHAVGLKRVINEANVALMTMYNHFESKEDLILEVLKRREERYFALLKEAAAHQEDVRNKALALAEAHVNWLRDNRKGCMFLRAKEEYPSSDSPINAYVIKHKQALSTFLIESHFNHQEATRLSVLLEGSTSLSQTMDIEDVCQELIFSIRKLF